MSEVVTPVLVIGAGIAGSATAIQLARAGISVHLVDKAQFPRDKVCGCCLNGSSVEALRELGVLPAVLKACAVPLSLLAFYHRGRKAVYPIKNGLACSRLRLDEILMNTAREAGVTVECEATGTIKTLGSTTDFATAEIRSARGVQEFKGIVVLASGLGLGGMTPEVRRIFCHPPSRHSYIGFGTHGEWMPEKAGTICLLRGRGGYLGCVRDETGRATFAAAADNALFNAGFTPADWISETLAVNHLTEDSPRYGSVHGRVHGKVYGTPALTRSASTLSSSGIFLVGDAAGFVEPFTGEGMSWAFRGARLLAPIVAAAAKGHTSAAQGAEEWQKSYGRSVGRRQKLCSLLTRSLHSDLFWSGITTFSSPIRFTGLASRLAQAFYY